MIRHGEAQSVQKVLYDNLRSGYAFTWNVSVEHNEHRAVLIFHGPFQTLRMQIWFPVIINIMSLVCYFCIFIAKIVSAVCFGP